MNTKALLDKDGCCSNCGEQIEDGAPLLHFCGFCGAWLINMTDAECRVLPLPPVKLPPPSSCQPPPLSG